MAPIAMSSFWIINPIVYIPVLPYVNIILYHLYAFFLTARSCDVHGLKSLGWNFNLVWIAAIGFSRSSSWHSSKKYEPVSRFCYSAVKGKLKRTRACLQPCRVWQSTKREKKYHNELPFVVLPEFKRRATADMTQLLHFKPLLFEDAKVQRHLVQLKLSGNRRSFFVSKWNSESVRCKNFHLRSPGDKN